MAGVIALRVRTWLITVGPASWSFLPPCRLTIGVRLLPGNRLSTVTRPIWTPTADPAGSTCPPSFRWTSLLSGRLSVPMDEAKSKELKEQAIAEWEARQSPVGFFNLALSYLDAADELTDRIQAAPKGERLHLLFDSPVRHLYAQTWELALKACLFAQGVRPIKLKRDFGHKVLKAWKHVDKNRFSRLDLSPSTEQIADHLGYYHSEKMFAYPVTGIREYLPLNHLKIQSQRFRIARLQIINLFLRAD